LVKEFRRQEMSLINDEKDIATLAVEITESGLELREETHKAKGRLDLQSQEDLVIEGHNTHPRVGQIDDGVESGIKPFGKGSNSGGFARTHVAGDEGRETLVKSE
jgi:hypothetical protein